MNQALYEDPETSSAGQSLNRELTAVNAQLRDKVDALEAANKVMASMLAGVDCATLFVAVDRTILRFTPGATRLFNLAATDIGRPIDAMSPRFDDPGLSQDIDRVLLNHSPCEREVALGQEQWFLRRIAPCRTADQRISGVMLTLTDITSLKRTELDLRDEMAHLQQRAATHSGQLQRECHFIDAILDTVGALVVVFDAEGRLVRFNAACNATTGHDFAEFLGTADWQMLIPAEETAGMQAVMARLQSGEAHVRHENHWLHRDGSPILLAWKNTVLRDEAGRVQYVIGTAIDITEQHRAENQARHHLEEVSRLQRVQTVNELATMLAHELNQPLAAIASYAEAGRQLLGRTPLEHDKVARNLERISQQSLRAGETIRHMRTFVGRGRIDPVPLDLNDVVRSTCALMVPRAHNRGIKLAADLDEGLPPVMGVDVHIEQVLVNLIRNAVDAIRDARMKGGRIAVVTRLEAGMARVSVVDSGPGIDAETAVGVFDFLSSTKKYGLGVGLRICRSLIAAHGGRLWVEPHTPGAIIHFILPFAP